MIVREMVIIILGDVDQAGLERLRSYLRLNSRGRWDEHWDEVFGERILHDDGVETSSVRLYRQLGGGPWSVHVVAGDSGLPDDELARLRLELVQGITAAGFRTEVRARPTHGPVEKPPGVASITEVPAANDGSTQHDAELSAEAGRLIEPIVQELASLGPVRWDRFTAVFAIAGPAEVARLNFLDGNDSRPAPVPVELMGLVHEHRAIAARMSAGPWWRLRLDVDNRGQVSQQFDYGDEPFPADQLFRPEDYRADLETWPRRRVPVWLAGFVTGPAAQGRSPDRAAAVARSEADRGVFGIETDDIVPLDEAWSRWAVLAAVRTGLRRVVGPWIEPAIASFENGEGSGSTLCILPRDRAVLSGGLWNSPLLDQAYNGGASLPDLYLGAPAWVNDSVLNNRHERGALSFCYWWQDGRWFRGGTNTFDELDDPLPAIWTDEETVVAITREVGDDRRDAAAALVAAANARSVPQSALIAVLPDSGADVEAAYNQLSLAGLVP